MNYNTDETSDLASSLPAIAGGEPAFPDGPSDWPGADPDVQASVKRALADGDWGRYAGKYHSQLVELLSDRFQNQHVQLCSSGTIATEIALRAINVQPGAEVVLAGYDFSGNFRAIEAVGAVPVLADIHCNNWCLNIESVRACLSNKTTAVIVSHLHGGLADLKALRLLADKHEFKIIEDACQVPGAIKDGQPLGTHADALTLSFGGSKLLTSGRGGAVLTQHESIAVRARTFCERGNDAFALSELQSAALIPQLEKLDQRTETRLRSVQYIAKYCSEFWLLSDLLPKNDQTKPAFFKLPWLVSDSISREDLIRGLQAEGIAADAGFRGFAKRSARRCRQPVSLENCKSAAEKTMVLHHPILLESADTIKRLADAIQRNYHFLLNHQNEKT